MLLVNDNHEEMIVMGKGLRFHYKVGDEIRDEKGIVLQNRMLWEIQKFYPNEFMLGLQAVDYIMKHFIFNCLKQKPEILPFTL